MVETLYNEKISVLRLAPVEEGSAKKEFAAHLTDIDCLIQPLADSISQDINSAFGKDFIVYCEIADIEQGDRVMRGSNTYKIMGVKNFEGYSDNDHMELIIRIFES